MLKRLSGWARLHGELEARGAEAVGKLTELGGPVDQAQALVGLTRAIADGLADELVRRLPFRMLYTPTPVPAQSWKPPVVPPAPVKRALQPVVVQASPSDDGFEAMTVVALKDAARHAGLVVRPRVKKSDLIAALRSL
jgi:hypothetical protein